MPLIPCTSHAGMFLFKNVFRLVLSADLLDQVPLMTWVTLAFFFFVYLEAISCLWSSQQRQTCKLLVCFWWYIGCSEFLFLVCLFVFSLTMIFSVALMHVLTFLYCMDLDLHLDIAYVICGVRVITCVQYWCSVLYLWAGMGFLLQLIFISHFFLV